MKSKERIRKRVLEVTNRLNNMRKLKRRMETGKFLSRRMEGHSATFKAEGHSLCKLLKIQLQHLLAEQVALSLFSPWPTGASSRWFSCCVSPPQLFPQATACFDSSKGGALRCVRNSCGNYLQLLNIALRSGCTSRSLRRWRKHRNSRRKMPYLSCMRWSSRSLVFSPETSPALTGLRSSLRTSLWKFMGRWIVWSQSRRKTSL